MPASGGYLWLRRQLETTITEKAEEAHTITLRNLRRGEVMTSDVDDYKKGKLTFLTSEGRVSIDRGAGGPLRDLFSWVPEYPGGRTGTREDLLRDGLHNYQFTVITRDPPSKVLHFYETKLQDAGFRVERSTLLDTSTLSATTDDGSRRIDVFAESSDWGTAVDIIATVPEKP